KATWSKVANELWTKQDSSAGEDKDKAEPYWSSVFTALQLDDYKEVKLVIKRPGEKEKTTIDIELEPDSTWPIDDRGLSLIQPQTRLPKASSFGEACMMGLTYTYQMIHKTYLGLKSMITGRISLEKGVSGPIGLLAVGKSVAGRGLIEFIHFLGIISISLAVLNFFPIPPLDGGHIVFLVYAKRRGKPCSEGVR